MTITVGVNSYIATDAANDYFTERLYADDWFSVSTSDQEKALVMARRIIDQQQFTGERTGADQVANARATITASIEESGCRSMSIVSRHKSFPNAFTEGQSCGLRFFLNGKAVRSRHPKNPCVAAPPMLSCSILN